MVYEKWNTIKQVDPNPKCVFCDTVTEVAIIFRSDAYTVRGWKCPKCGFTLIHPLEIHKALELLRQIAQI